MGEEARRRGGAVKSVWVQARGWAKDARKGEGKKTLGVRTVGDIVGADAKCGRERRKGADDDEPQVVVGEVGVGEGHLEEVLIAAAARRLSMSRKFVCVLGVVARRRLAEQKVQLNSFQHVGLSAEESTLVLTKIPRRTVKGK
jgi:hypothetical protein